jgi:hypothetical protein
MVTACLFLGFGRPVAGREEEAFAYLMKEGTETFQRYQKEGWCESVQFVGLTPHGGDLNAFVILNGERAKLDELRRTDDFEKVSMRLNRLFAPYGVIPGVTGEGIRRFNERNPELTKK